MKILPVEHMAKIKKAVPRIEDKLSINISFSSGRITIKGNELNEYLTEKIIRAVDFGFDIEDALLLKNEQFIIEFIDVKEHTHRKNLRDVRSRIIGTGGKAKKTIENLTGAIIVIQENTVGIIVDNEHADTTIQALESLIQGSKHGNVFMYLEKQNVTRKQQDDDLGLKEGIPHYEEDEELMKQYDEYLKEE